MVQRGLDLQQDDLDGSPAEVRLTFSLDGVRYEIDLSAANARRLRAELRPWIGHARITGGRRARRGGPAPVDRTQLAKIRQWATQNELPVKSRGRIPAAVQRAFADAHS